MRKRKRSKFRWKVHEPLYVDCHGFTVEEMLWLVDKEIDKCIFQIQYTIQIVHGVGKGILRRALHKYLDELVNEGRIDGYSLGGPLKDDPAETIVYVDCSPGD